ncbi:MAG: hypothetical protein AAB019_05720 [Planctomycetota bacterium]
MARLIGILGLLILLGSALVLAEEKSGTKLSPETEKQVKGLVTRLGSDDLQERETAQKELLTLGMPIRPLLEAALKETKDPEVRMRLNQLLKEIPDNAAKELVFQGLDNLLKAKNYRIEVETKVCVSMFGKDVSEVISENKQTITLSGVYQNQDLTYLRGKTDKDEAECYVQSGWMVIREPGSKKWMKISNREMGRGRFFISINSVQDVKMVKEWLEKTRMVGEEKIGETICQVVEATLNREKMKKSFQMLEDDMNRINKSVMKFYLGKKDCLLYKLDTEFETETGMIGRDFMKDSWVTAMKFSDYGKMEPIVIPAEVKELLESD